MPTIRGYGAVFFDPRRQADTEFRLDEDVYERIDPHAFDDSLKKGDVVGAFNHNVDYLLGRRSAGTMRLSVDQRGLRYEIDLSDSIMADHVRQAVARGDLSGSSFAFVTTRQTFHEELRGGKRVVIRTLEKVQLLETGPVAMPAYSGTTAAVA